MVSPWLPEFAGWVHSLGVWAPIAFVAAYIAVVVLMLPAFLLIMAGGAVFGVVEGSLLALLGAVLGGTAAFLIGRHYARAAVERRVASNPTLSALDHVIGEDGLKLVFLLRLSPAVPFVLTNYALSITRVRLRDFFIGTLGLAPIVVMYAAYGSASGATPNADGSAAVTPMMFTAGIVVTVLLGLLLAKIVQKALREAELSRLKQLEIDATPETPTVLPTPITESI
uniref:TVP38/TMEM64 family membrane protein n=1 Tax=uncultured bacterium AH1 TaxID=104110 RepID=Q9RPT3_9BACT|nr:hypothetical transmembrane protein [uncultured bacterium AH1]